jgi:hypothetical protein
MPTVEDILGPRPEAPAGKQGKPTVESILGPRTNGSKRVPRGTSRTGFLDRDYPALPFMTRTILAGIKEPDKQAEYLENQFGKGSVGTDKKGLYVTVNGKRMRASTGFATETAAQTPEIVGMGAGAASGAAMGLPGGPIGVAVGGIIGAGVGAMAGRSSKEFVKSATGYQSQRPGEIIKSVERAGEEGMMAEAGGKALGLLRKVPIRSALFDTTPETKAMTDRLLKKGAIPPYTSTMPSARTLQRMEILKEKVAGINQARRQANIESVQTDINAILKKAGITGKAIDDTMQRVVGSESAISTQEAGRFVQNALKMVRSNYPKDSKEKVVAYLDHALAHGRTPEDAIDYILQPGQTDILQRIFEAKGVGKNSQVTQVIQHVALKKLLAGALERTESTWDLGVLDLISGAPSVQQAAEKYTIPKGGIAIGTLERGLKEYTPKQQKLLFGPVLNDLKLVSKDIQFLFPKIIDPAMAGMSAGAILQRPLLGGGGGSMVHGKSYIDVFHSRVGAQLYYGITDMLFHQPTMIRRLAVGLRNTKTREATRALMKDMMYMGALQLQDEAKEDKKRARPNPRQ